MNHQGWIASLSNGETAFEQPPVPGEKSSWQKLLDRVSTGEVRITQMRLIRNGCSIVCVFHKQAQGYCMAYEAIKVMFRNTTALLQGVGSIYNEMVFMTWVDENGNVHQDIRPLSEMRVHTTLRDAQNGENERTKHTII